MNQTLSLTRKELNSYFGSPMALIFLGTFLLATLFVFFWVDAFFARGVADVRPLFRWMPLLLIFLVAALTMRQWSEEQRSGTLEMLLTLPVSATQMVIGKFLAVMALVALALALTLPLPITASLLGNLDWGPVLGGYLAGLLLAAAYAAIGLFISSRTDNQIVALIATALLGGFFYLLGTGGVVDFFGAGVGDILRALGTGSRFESIQRGVIDLRDLVYYGSLTGIFLALNVLSLNSKRWSEGEAGAPRRTREVLLSSLLVVNLLLANVWLYPLQSLRLDVTESRTFSLAPATRNLLQELDEPLLIRAYVSDRTHPLLAPLVPRIEDTLAEYEIAGNGRVSAEVVDPSTDAELEEEANQIYGIQPVPFQVTDRYEASVINSYFDILVRYGDQTEVINFQELINVEQNRDGTLDVNLQNLEYDLTSTITRVASGFQSVDAVLAALDQPVNLTLVVTPETLPEPLLGAQETILRVADEIAAEANGNFTVETLVPTPEDQQRLLDQYGIQPYPVSFFSNETYYLHMLLTAPDGQGGESVQVIYPDGDLSEATVRTAIESALRRNTSGFLSVVGLWTPPATPTVDQFGQQQQPLATFNTLRQQLSAVYEVRDVDLNTGSVPNEIDALFVVAPQNMTDRERFAIDQYLMRGGALIVAAGNYRVDIDQFAGTLSLLPIDGGLREMLQHYGVDVQEQLVLDLQNEGFPISDSQGFFQLIDYPFFPTVFPENMGDSPIVAGLPAVTLQWASPIVAAEVVAGAGEESGDEVSEDGATAREVEVLLESSEESWLRTDTNIQPDFETYPNFGFGVEGAQGSQPLAVSVRGEFDSYFVDRPLPFGENAPEPPIDPANPEAAPPADAQPVGLIENSSADARLVVIGSGEFVNDFIFELSDAVVPGGFANTLLFAQNTVDWATEETDLLTIRNRGSSVRVLQPLSAEQQTAWEIGNYVIALLALIVIGGLWWWRRNNEQPMDLGEPAAAGD